MGILKERSEPNRARHVLPMVFPAFPEDMLHVEPGDGDISETGDEAAGATAFDLEAARREAETLMQDARGHAEGIHHAAQREAADLLEGARRDAENIKTTAAAAGEQTKKEAYASGFASGEEAGYKKGYEDGFAKGKAQSAEETRQSLGMMSRVVEDLKSYRTQLLSEARADIVKMALAVAEKVLHKEIMLDPNAVVSLVKNALSKVSFKRQFVIHVNPLDMEVLQSAGSEIAATLESAESLQFKANPKVEPGGCIVQTESGSVDAQVDRQFAEIRDSVLGALEKEES